MPKYGIYDTQDKCWLGNDDGPLLYEEGNTGKMPPETMAQVAAQVAAVQLGYSMTRLQVRVFNEKNLKRKDSVTTKMSAAKALEMLEEGKA